MDKQVAEIVWIEPNIKEPEISKGAFDKKIITAYGNPLIGEKETDIIVECVGYDEHGFQGNHQHSVIRYAELPAPYDPEAKQVNFQTAMLWMQEGCCMQSLVSYNQHWLVADEDNGCLKHISSISNNGSFTYEEIMGLWERVE